MFSPGEVAVHLNVTRRTVYTWIKEGRLQAVKVGVKLWQVSAREIERFTSEPPSEQQLLPVEVEPVKPSRFIEALEKHVAAAPPDATREQKAIANSIVEAYRAEEDRQAEVARSVRLFSDSVPRVVQNQTRQPKKRRR